MPLMLFLKYLVYVFLLLHVFALYDNNSIIDRQTDWNIGADRLIEIACSSVVQYHHRAIHDARWNKKSLWHARIYEGEGRKAWCSYVSVAPSLFYLFSLIKFSYGVIIKNLEDLQEIVNNYKKMRAEGLWPTGITVYLMMEAYAKAGLYDKVWFETLCTTAY